MHRHPVILYPVVSREKTAGAYSETPGDSEAASRT